MGNSSAKWRIPLWRQPGNIFLPGRISPLWLNPSARPIWLRLPPLFSESVSARCFRMWGAEIIGDGTEFAEVALGIKDRKTDDENVGGVPDNMMGRWAASS